MVKAVMNGAQEIVSIFINKEVVDPDDVEMLEDLIIAAIKKTRRRRSKRFPTRLSAIYRGKCRFPGLT